MNGGSGHTKVLHDVSLGRRPPVHFGVVSDEVQVLRLPLGRFSLLPRSHHFLSESSHCHEVKTTFCVERFVHDLYAVRYQSIGTFRRIRCLVSTQ